MYLLQVNLAVSLFNTKSIHSRVYDTAGDCPEIEAGTATEHFLSIKLHESILLCRSGFQSHWNNIFISDSQFQRVMQTCYCNIHKHNIATSRSDFP